MIYYDIHTHQAPGNPDVVAIVNTLVGTAQEPVSLRSTGIHPCHIYNVEEQLGELYHQTSLSGIVAIGETGLDKRSAAPLSVQLEILHASASFAERHSLPLILHCVRAWDELITMKKTIRPRQAWIIHGFRGKAPLAEQLLRQGFYLSFGEHFHPESVRTAWPDRLFAETDEAADIRFVYTRLASTLQLPLEELAAGIARNTLRILPASYFSIR